MPENPPYVYAYGKLRTLFDKIREASAPPKFTIDFLSTSLGFTSSSDRALPAFLKRLGFIDSANVPTREYSEYRDPTRSRQVMARQVRIAYADLFKVNEYAYKLSKNELTGKVKQITGLAEGDQVLNAIVGSFLALRDLADFEAKGEPRSLKEVSEEPAERVPTLAEAKLKLGMSYTIVLNLPATTDINVFNAIFKSLKENILSE